MERRQEEPWCLGLDKSLVWATQQELQRKKKKEIQQLHTDQDTGPEKLIPQVSEARTKDVKVTFSVPTKAPAASACVYVERQNVS